MGGRAKQARAAQRAGNKDTASAVGGQQCRVKLRTWSVERGE
jgi:hypothetical protein